MKVFLNQVSNSFSNLNSNLRTKTKVDTTAISRRTFRRVSSSKNDYGEKIVNAEIERHTPVPLSTSSYGVSAAIRLTMLPVERRFDNEFYFVKIQIRSNEETCSLKHWRFEVFVSDRQPDTNNNRISSNRYRRKFSNLKVDPRDGMIYFNSSTIFGDVARKTLSPTQDLKWLRTSYPVQL